MWGGADFLGGGQDPYVEEKIMELCRSSPAMFPHRRGGLNPGQPSPAQPNVALDKELHE